MIPKVKNNVKLIVGIFYTLLGMEVIWIISIFNDNSIIFVISIILASLLSIYGIICTFKALSEYIESD